jgi:TM2 domain-containing membrane protein YozV
MALVPPEPATNPAAVAYAPRNALLTGPIAGFLAWLVPGLGHIYLGHRVRGVVCLVTITVTFWTGVAIGGVQATVDPHERSFWFMAQICTGGNTLAAYGLHRVVEPQLAAGQRPVAALAHWLSSEVGVHYTGVAGLLNLLVILDALGRADAPSPKRTRRDHPPGAPRP